MIAKAVAAAVIGGEVADGVGVEVTLEGLGRVIGAAAFGLRVSDLHSSGDEPRFLTKRRMRFLSTSGGKSEVSNSTRVYSTDSI